MYASPALVEHVVEEGAELGADDLRGLVGDVLHHVLEPTLGHQRAGDPVEVLDRARVGAQALLHAGRLVLGAAPGDRAAEAGGDEPQRETFLRLGDAAGHGDLEAPDVLAPVVQRHLHARPALPGVVVLGGAEALAALEHDRGRRGAEGPRERVERGGEQLVGGQDVERRVDHGPQPREQVALTDATALGAHHPRRLSSGTLPLRV